MTRSRVRCILALGLLTVLPCYAQQEPPKELLQYVHDARKAGLKDDQIQQNALKAGWPTATVAEAIRSAPASGRPRRDDPAAPARPAERPPEPKPVETLPAKNEGGAPSAQPSVAVDRGATDGDVIGEAPNELVHYIRDARKAGLKDDQIQQNALKAGWPTATVAEAIRSAPASAPASGGPRRDPAAPAQPAERLPEPKPVETLPAKNEAGTRSAQPAVAVDRGAPDDYVIGEGDVLHISVWKEPDASVASAVVRTDGKISMPMLKEVEVSGLTPIQAEKTITEKLTKFITAADVTVIVSAMNSKKIYIIGGVKKEGPIPYTYRMTVFQALSEAGGLTDYAKKKKIYVLHYENGREYRFPFDYDAAIKGEGMALNRVLLPGDTLVVPK